MSSSTPLKLKLISLCSGMMFWYGIEQLFMDNFLDNPSARAFSTVVYVVTLLLLDIPGGMIADRFGRRITIVLGAILQFSSVLIMGLSTSINVFLVGVFIYGTYWALCNGAAQAMMYDHLAEINEHAQYAKQQGSAYAYGYLGAGIANLSSGVIAYFWGLRAPYLLSVLPAIVALVIALKLREAPYKPANKPHTPINYLQESLRTMQRSKLAVVYASQLVIGVFVFMTIGEFGQITLLTYNSSEIWLGFMWAICAATVALALYQAHRLQHRLWQSILGYVGLLLAFATLVTNPVLGTICFIAVYAGVEAVHTISETALQHATKSVGRATILSGVNFIGNLLAIPIIWLFNSLLQRQGILFANRTTALIIAALFSVSALMVVVRSKSVKQAT